MFLIFFIDQTIYIFMTDKKGILGFDGILLCNKIIPFLWEYGK